MYTQLWCLYLVQSRMFSVNTKNTLLKFGLSLLVKINLLSALHSMHTIIFSNLQYDS